jgi:hypothetical protein
VLTSHQSAIEAIDRANADDPNTWNDEPLALAQGRIAHSWVVQLDPAASGALQLAARAHHLRRWVVPRASYPEGRPGYLRWRRDQKQRHAAELSEILIAAGVEPATVDRAATIVAKLGLDSDPEVQVFEDAVCLTFVETQFDTTADRLDADLMVDVVAKTLAKMSDAGRSAALTLDLDARATSIVTDALARLAAR